MGMQYFPTYDDVGKLVGIRDQNGHTVMLANIETYMTIMGTTRVAWLLEHPWIIPTRTRKQAILDKSSFTNADRDELLRILAEGE